MSEFAGGGVLILYPRCPVRLCCNLSSHKDEPKVRVRGRDENFEKSSTKERAENFTKYYFLTPPSAFAEGGSKIFGRGVEEMLEGG